MTSVFSDKMVMSCANGLIVGGGLILIGCTGAIVGILTMGYPPPIMGHELANTPTAILIVVGTFFSGTAITTGFHARRGVFRLVIPFLVAAWGAWIATTVVAIMTLRGIYEVLFTLFLLIDVQYIYLSVRKNGA